MNVKGKEQKKRKLGPPRLVVPREVSLEETKQTESTSLTLIRENLYVSGFQFAKDTNALERVGITHVLNLVGHKKPVNTSSDQFSYKSLNMPDSPKVDILFFVYFAFDYIRSAHEEGGKVLVHCERGISRAPTVAAAYLMLSEGVDEFSALQELRRTLPSADPNIGFLGQLRSLQMEPLSPKIYRYNNKCDMFTNSGEGFSYLMLQKSSCSLVLTKKSPSREAQIALSCIKLWESIKGSSATVITI